MSSEKTVAILESLEQYFESLTDYLKQTDQKKFEKLTQLVAQCKVYKAVFDKLAHSAETDAQRFEFIATFTSTIELISRIYGLLDFRLPVGEEISQSRVFRLTEVFNKVTSVYRLYMRDIVAEYTTVVDATAAAVTTRDPRALQTLWQKHPNSIDVYSRVMSELLAAAEGVKKSEIMTILEEDKIFILKETDWISPFLSFNAIPVKKVESLSFIKAADGVVMITRNLPNNKTHVLPERAMFYGPGITKDNISSLIADVTPEATRYDWRVVITNSGAKRFHVVENLSSGVWRVLDVASLDTLIAKIASHKFGRPEAYHAYLDEPLRAQLSNRTRNLSKEKARTIDVGLNILRITDELVKSIKPSKKTLRDKLHNDSLIAEFETAVAAEISPHVHLKDALLYWLEWTKNTFRKELDVAIAKHGKPEELDSIELAEYDRHLAHEILHRVVEQILKPGGNIFQDLFDKQHIFDTVALNTRET